MSGLTYYLVAAALSIHQHMQHPGTRHVRTAGNEGRITLRVAHVVGFGIEPSFFPALIVVAGTQVSLFTSQPCVVFGERGGGVESVLCQRWRGAFTRTAPGNGAGCISDKQTEDRGKIFMQLPTRIYLTAALNFVTTHC